MTLYSLVNPEHQYPYRKELGEVNVADRGDSLVKLIKNMVVPQEETCPRFMQLKTTSWKNVNLTWKATLVPSVCRPTAAEVLALLEKANRPRKLQFLLTQTINKEGGIILSHTSL